MKGKWIVLVQVLTLACSINFPSLPCDARRSRGTRYPLEIYHISGTKLGKPVIDSRYSFPFPVSVSHHHVSAYLWVKGMIEEGRFPRGLPLIYLDTHLDYPIGDDKPPQSSNWVRFVLKETLCKKVILILPNWLEKEIHTAYRLKLEDDVEKIQLYYQQPLSVLDSIEELPDGESLGPIILSIDCDYFCNIDYPDHRASREEIIEEINRIIDLLKRKNVKVVGLNISISPGYTSLGQEAFIKDELLKAFSEYGNEE